MSENSLGMSLQEYRRLALMALWTGLIASLGMLFVFVPNIEMVILTAFLAGIAMGPKQGFLVAALGEAIFSALNPIGSGLGFPVLFMLQILAIGFSGAMGGWVGPVVNRSPSTLSRSALLGVIGFCLTLIYDLLTALSLPLATGITEGTLLGTLLSGLAFMVMHMVSNTLLFTLLGPPLVILVLEQIQMHGLGNSLK